jgi:hypothetical protein
MKIFALFFILFASAIFGQESYRTLLQHWDYDERAPLNMKQVGIRKCDGVSIYDISFASPMGNRSTFSFRMPDAKVISAISVLAQPPWPKSN